MEVGFANSTYYEKLKEHVNDTLVIKNGRLQSLVVAAAATEDYRIFL